MSGLGVLFLTGLSLALEPLRAWTGLPLGLFAEGLLLTDLFGLGVGLLLRLLSGLMLILLLIFRAGLALWLLDLLNREYASGCTSALLPILVTAVPLFCSSPFSRGDLATSKRTSSAASTFFDLIAEVSFSGTRGSSLSTAALEDIFGFRLETRALSLYSSEVPSLALALSESLSGTLFDLCLDLRSRLLRFLSRLLSFLLLWRLYLSLL